MLDKQVSFAVARLLIQRGYATPEQLLAEKQYIRMVKRKWAKS
jgi:hypothetical protein